MAIRRLALVFVFTLFLFGDVMYKTVTTTQGVMGVERSEVTKIFFIKGDCSRVETIFKKPPSDEVRMVRITRFDKGIIWTVDLEKEEYSETRLDEATAARKEKQDEEEEIAVETKVERTGEKKTVLAKECEKVIVLMDVNSDNASMNVKQTMWVTSDIPGYEEIRSFQRKRLEHGIESLSLNTMGMDKASFEEFRQKVSGIDGFPLELILGVTIRSDDVAFSFETNSVVTRIEQVPINQKVFEIPSGYTLIE